MFTLVHQFCIFHLFFCVNIIKVCQDQSPVNVLASIGINKLLVNNPVSCTFMPMHHNSHNSLAWSCCLGIVAHLQAMHKPCHHLELSVPQNDCVPSYASYVSCALLV